MDMFFFLSSHLFVILGPSKHTKSYWKHKNLCDSMIQLFRLGNSNFLVMYFVLCEENWSPIYLLSKAGPAMEAEKTLFTGAKNSLALRKQTLSYFSVLFELIAKNMAKMTQSKRFRHFGA